MSDPGHTFLDLPQMRDDVADTQRVILTCEDLMNEVLDDLNGLSEAYVFGEMKLQLQYRPREVEVCRARPMKMMSVDSALSRAGSMGVSAVEFVLRVDLADTSELTTFIMPGLEDRVRLIADGESHKCAFAHVESGAAHSPYTTILLGFELDPTFREITIEIAGLQAGSQTIDLVFPSDLLNGYQKIIQS